MAKGNIAKEQIFKKMLEVFEGSFIYNNGKELRIPWDEGNGEIQIKVALTCAKENVSIAGENSPKDAAAAFSENSTSNFPEPLATVAEPTPEEKQNVEDLLKALGLN